MQLYLPTGGDLSPKQRSPFVSTSPLFKSQRWSAQMNALRGFEGCVQNADIANDERGEEPSRTRNVGSSDSLNPNSAMQVHHPSTTNRSMQVSATHSRFLPVTRLVPKSDHLPDAIHCRRYWALLTATGPLLGHLQPLLSPLPLLSAQSPPAIRQLCSSSTPSNLSISYRATTPHPRTYAPCSWQGVAHA